LLKRGSEFVTVKQEPGRAIEGTDQLELVLEDGVVRRDQTLDEIRGIASSFDSYEKKAP
jgi:hypothetical protein